MQRGFTLIEISLVLALVCMLGAFAYPVYQQHVITTRRLEAAATLSRLSAALEQYYVENGSYEGATLEGLHFTELADYQLSLRINRGNEYVLRAKPYGLQAERDSVCGVLSLNEKMEKFVSGTGTVEGCF